MAEKENIAAGVTGKRLSGRFSEVLRKILPFELQYQTIQEV